MVFTLVLWCVGLPVIATLTLADKMRIGGLWYLLVLFYSLIQLFMFASYIGADWARTGQASQEPRLKRQMDFWTKATSSFLMADYRPVMTLEYQSAYEKAKDTLRDKVASFGSPTNGTYTSVYYEQGGSERITFFSATQLYFEPLQDLRDVDDGRCGKTLARAEFVELIDNCEDRFPTYCWKIHGHGNDSDGSFVISEGFIVASGHAYWIEESTPNKNIDNGCTKSTFSWYCYPSDKNTTNRMILNRGVFDFADNSFTGSWISNIAGAVERPHHPEFRLQQSFNLAQQLAAQNVLVVHQHPQRDNESSQPMTAVTEAEAGPRSRDDAGGRQANAHSVHSSIVTTALCPIFTTPPTSGLYRCGYREKGVFVWLTLRLLFEPHSQKRYQDTIAIDKMSSTEQEAATDQIPLSDTSSTPAGDKSGSSGVSFSYVHNDGLRQDGIWKIKGNGTTSLGVTFSIVEGLVSAKTGKAYWIEQEEIAYQSQLIQSKPTDDEESNSLKIPGRFVLSTGTFSFVMQDFVGWRQSSDDAPCCRYHEFGLFLQEEHDQGLENQQEAQQLSIAYQNAHEDAKSRVDDDVASLVLSPSLSGYYYDDSCTPTNGTYTFSYYSQYNEENGNSEHNSRPLLISTVRLHFEANDKSKNTIDNNNNNCGDNKIGDSTMHGQSNGTNANSIRAWTITGMGKNASDGSAFLISEGLVSASGKAYWVQTSSWSSFILSTGSNSNSTNHTQQRVVCTGDFVFAPLSHEVDFRGGWCNTSGQKRCFNQFSLLSSSP